MENIRGISLPYFVKAELTSYLVFSIIFIPIIVLCTIMAIEDPNSNAWPGIVLFSLALCFFYFSSRTT